jgi:hypothetical protein
MDYSLQSVLSIENEYLLKAFVVEFQELPLGPIAEPIVNQQVPTNLPTEGP